MTTVAFLLWLLVAGAVLVVTHPGFPWVIEVPGLSADDHWDHFTRNQYAIIDETLQGLAAPLDPRSFVDLDPPIRITPTTLVPLPLNLLEEWEELAEVRRAMEDQFIHRLTDSRDRPIIMARDLVVTPLGPDGKPSGPGVPL